MADLATPIGLVALEDFGADLANSVPSILSGIGTTPTAWTELVASTSADAVLLALSLLGDINSGTFGGIRIDIGVGPSGSEVPVVEGWFLQGRGSGNFLNMVENNIPVQVPAGSRLSIRATSDATSTSLMYKGRLYGGAFLDDTPYSLVTAYGFNADGINGIDVDAGPTANTKSAWAEIVASMPDDVKAFYLCIGGSDNTALANGEFLFDVAIGPSGNEQIIAANMGFRATSSEGIRLPMFVAHPLPVGTRVAIRMQSTITDSADRVQDFTILGLR